MAEQQCPVCRRDSYINPGIKILVSPCFHKLCEQCVHEIFSRGYAPCPECQVPLRRVNYTSTTFENVAVECEIRIRRLVNRHLVRAEEEFANSEEYNDYLEAYEDFVFSLLDCKNETQIRKRINEIKQGNSILTPIDRTAAAAKEGAAQAKRAKPNEPLWTSPGKRPDVRLGGLYDISEDIVALYEPGGVTKQLLNQMVLGALFYS